MRPADLRAGVTDGQPDGDGGTGLSLATWGADDLVASLVGRRPRVARIWRAIPSFTNFSLLPGCELSLILAQASDSLVSGRFSSPSAGISNSEAAWLTFEEHCGQARDE